MCVLDSADQCSTYLVYKIDTDLSIRLKNLQALNMATAAETWFLLKRIVRTGCSRELDILYGILRNSEAKLEYETFIIVEIPSPRSLFSHNDSPRTLVFRP